MSKLAAALITHNEEKRISECLKALDFVDEIVVVDSCSQDQTAQIAMKAGAKVYSRTLDDFSTQKNFAIDQTSADWILLVDADEQPTDELKREIRESIEKQDGKVGYYLKRDNIVFGSPLKFGASLNDVQLRLIKKGCGRFSGLVHERIQPTGPVGMIKNPLIHKTYQKLEEYFSKFDLFSTLDAKELAKQGKKTTWFDVLFQPPFHFLYFYFLKLGFMDGKAGFIYQVLSSYYVFVRSVKAIEYQKGLEN